ncbi:hypothetical protein I3843_09G019900 [Carya illinoinensis]|uniref:Late embryogenesis abundant protein LEA-2 subgroup domain-containing protein n=1 Tax=Carya illinoinensis TaxID=32201 RepID=A0A8T1P9F6_CARIL|nr:uncharacterized protein LOC122275937 [Carya illinoinensis]KAG6640669.1 hypothetical protein CIPAW_09G020400 [Carya illinoinensis]KAG6693805.1 hypothetical protein I3842_09G020000 [Carya illinoinensis]KAG7961496.1 hypothetical protein I3843_09G019900 [Carya illinoinensis]
MASRSEDQPGKEPGQPSDANQNNAPTAPNGHPQPPTSHTPVMGYPYPNPYGQPYHGYPPNANNAAYPYNSQPPPAAYYHTQSSHPSSGSGFFRGCLVAVVIFVVLSFLTSLVMWFVLRPEFPVFRVDTFTVSNFNASEDFDLKAIWEANVTVSNPNHKLKVYLNEIENSLLYNEELLTFSYGEPLLLDTKGQGVLRVKLSRNNPSDPRPVLDKLVLKEISLDQSAGSMSFNFRMVVSTAFRHKSWWTTHRTLGVFCDELNVGFVGASGNGTFPAGQSRVCAVYV